MKLKINHFCADVLMWVTIGNLFYSFIDHSSVIHMMLFLFSIGVLNGLLKEFFGASFFISN